jgi:tRNA (mo5U34)-methyltransferase
MKEMKDIKWFHSIEIEPGVHTISAAETEKLRKRENSYFKGVDFTGKSVLDIGAWDGYFSFAAKRRGAGRILSTDHVCWSGPGWGNKDGYDFARTKLGMTDIEDKDIDIPDISPESVGKFDIVLFMGIFYHLRHPFLGLEKAASVAKDTIIVETALDATLMRRPMMVFYPGSELANDPSNWWGPNIPLMLALLKDLGFTKIECRKDPIWRRRAHFVARR